MTSAVSTSRWLTSSGLDWSPRFKRKSSTFSELLSQAYWEWVAAGQLVRIQQQIVDLAVTRNRNVEIQVEAGDLPEVAKVDNGRFIAKREANLTKANRLLQKTAIKLSLFYRDAEGVPVIADRSQLPEDFPEHRKLDPDTVEADIQAALAQRPELRDLEFQRQQTEVELRYAQNRTLPKLDAYADASQDVGEPASSLQDKSRFELEVGVLAEVPLQRRKAAGEIQAAEAKLGQIAAKRKFVVDKIRIQVEDAVSALNQAAQRIDQGRENLRLTERALELGRILFDEGDIDLIELNIYETSLADAELLLVDSQLTYFAAMADYRAALAAPLAALPPPAVMPAAPQNGG